MPPKPHRSQARYSMNFHEDPRRASLEFYRALVGILQALGHGLLEFGKVLELVWSSWEKSWNFWWTGGGTEDFQHCIGVARAQEERTARTATVVESNYGLRYFVWFCMFLFVASHWLNVSFVVFVLAFVIFSLAFIVFRNRFDFAMIIIVVNCMFDAFWFLGGMRQMCNVRIWLSFEALGCFVESCFFSVCQHDPKHELLDHSGWWTEGVLSVAWSSLWYRKNRYPKQQTLWD